MTVDEGVRERTQKKPWERAAVHPTVQVAFALAIYWGLAVVTFASCAREVVLAPPTEPPPLVHGQLHVPRDYATIQDALDVAADDCTVYVAPGTYTGPRNCSLVIRQDAIHLIGTAGSGSTTIACDTGGRQQPGWDMAATGWCEVSGLTIRGGARSAGGCLRVHRTRVDIRDCAFRAGVADSGGGVFLRESHVYFSRCSFGANTARVGGGGLMAVGGRTRLSGSEFLENRAPSGAALTAAHGILELSSSRVQRNGGGAESGAAISVQDGLLHVQTTLISKNQGGLSGGGLEISGGTTLSAELVTVAENQCAGRGGGLYVAEGSGAELSRCLIAENCAAEGSDAYVAVTGMLAQECTFLDSTRVAISGLWSSYDGSLGGDPGFMATSGCGLEGESNFRPRSDSQCRDVPHCGTIGWASGKERDGGNAE